MICLYSFFVSIGIHWNLEPSGSCRPPLFSRIVWRGQDENQWQNRAIVEPKGSQIDQKSFKNRPKVVPKSPRAPQDPPGVLKGAPRAAPERRREAKGMEKEAREWQKSTRICQNTIPRTGRFSSSFWRRFLISVDRFLEGATSKKHAFT